MNNKKEKRQKGTPFVICEKSDDALSKDISALWRGRIGAKVTNQLWDNRKVETLMDFASQICSFLI